MKKTKRIGKNETNQRAEKQVILDSYQITADQVQANVRILKTPKEFVPIYRLTYPKVEQATRAVLDDVRERLLAEISITPTEVIGLEETETLKQNFLKKSLELLAQELPKLSERNRQMLAGILLHRSFGLGPIELMLQDKNLEEIVINSSAEPLWVYHIRLGWLKTNVTVPSDNEIYNYAALIGRRVGAQITHLNPLMDAYMATGDRANATLFPVSSRGNTLTIRKFARRPWTVTDFIELKTLTPEVAAFLWLAIQYELNILIAGGTASGKTCLLNVLSCFIPPNHRVISIEDTREIQLPKFLHWVPMTTRPPNPEGKGEITMLQLMINALRMRPDRIVVGEIRRGREAEVLFEAIHTGHSVYSTLHANTAAETLRRLINPPINIPASLLNSLQLIVAMHRDRRREIRRLLEVSELVGGSGEAIRMELGTIFRWLPSKDQIIKSGKSQRAMEEIKLFTGMSDRELENDQNDKIKILKWLVKNQVKDINKVGLMVSEYYANPERVLNDVKK